MSKLIKTPVLRLICAGSAKASTLAVEPHGIPEADPELSFV